MPKEFISPFDNYVVPMPSTTPSGSGETNGYPIHEGQKGTSYSLTEVTTVRLQDDPGVGGQAKVGNEIAIGKGARVDIKPLK